MLGHADLLLARGASSLRGLSARAAVSALRGRCSVDWSNFRLRPDAVLK